jgi:N-methylhydantoinase A/oxoprolinase/acetone carboxylase beta subunit
MIRIGIDVGGTNTDAVLLRGSDVVAATKRPTTPDVGDGVIAALRAVLEQSAVPAAAVQAVMIGTTHFVNAVVQRRDLTPVAALRVSLPAAARIPPFADWPADLRALVRGQVHMVQGGHEVDGRPIMPIDHAAIRDAARAMRRDGVVSVGITAAFSPLTAEAEDTAAAIVRDEYPDIAITLSHNLGRIGLLARENVTLLNACLIPLARRTIDGFEQALATLGIAAPLYITQNDGTVVRADQAATYPVYCFASGPTNSLRGAAFLSGLDQAVVIDIGGTTADFGALVQGFPRQANNVIQVGGVRTLFRMPDLLSIGLGGGSIVDPQHPETIGPASVGYRLTEQARVFGGDILTCTDIGVAAGLIDLGDRSRVAGLSAAFVSRALGRIHAMIEDNADRMKTSQDAEPLIAVGGGGFLMPTRVKGFSNVARVEHQAVANAVGAAIAQVSGEIDRVFTAMGRADALQAAERVARERAVANGADAGSIEVVEVEDLPLAYLPGDSLRVRVRVVGAVHAHTRA